ncbi:hypothetical protein BDW75DRAFT_228666 [Aspergillus navahoensis]
MRENIPRFGEFQQGLPPAIPSTNLAAELANTPDLPVNPGMPRHHTLTVWNEETLIQEFQTSNRGFFVLTNSRALPTTEARELIRYICIAVKEAAAKARKPFEIVLRGELTLSGHFPDEHKVAEEAIGGVHGWILAPFSYQGGRCTIGGFHYVLDPGGNLIPAAQTQVGDAIFGYKYIKRYLSISLYDIRTGSPQAVAEELLAFERARVIIVNALTDTNIEVFMLELLKAKSREKSYIYWTDAAFVSARLGIRENPPLIPASLGLNTDPCQPGGLILAGSYVLKTTEQLQALIEGQGSDLQVIILRVEDLLRSREQAEQTALDAADKAGEFILKGQDVLVMASRDHFTRGGSISSLKIGSTIGAALVLFVRMLIPRPRYIIAEGGATSWEAACKGLRMRRIQVFGQAAPGIPLWQCSEVTSNFRGIPHIVFPRNAGKVDTLRDLVAAWSKETKLRMEYQRLGQSSLMISSIILGCMTFGNPYWEGSPWVLPEKEALPLLQKAYDCGINTWDTANTYSNGLSEVIIGKALRRYSNPREKVVILTNSTTPDSGQTTSTCYKSTSSMTLMHCWQLARLHYTAKLNNWTGVSSMQNLYNLLYREEEQEVNPFCDVEGIGLIPWSPLARGLLARPADIQTERSKRDAKTAKWFAGDQNEKINRRVQQIAAAKGCSMAAVAMAWLLHKGACPIVGLNSIERIEAVIKVFGVRLTDEEVRLLEEHYRPRDVQAL